MFGLFREKPQGIDFSEENIERFKILLTDIYEVLRDSAYTAQANWILQILAAVENRDQEIFKKKVISSELLGGSGSVIDVWIEDEKKMKWLDSRLNDFLVLTLKSGLNHKAVKSRIKS
ncbi:hypothetical protein [Mariniradius sediminis]|jgi:hypothetical protein|uniref:Uncharacterized protein n=1 Tax=Mariniradius sediminis TaxID=2909237 RepID=A0ABS9BNM5_9BACT|nr:hypothetical protein [Mariniradius sediminis]MCF1749658.1 hypothetical protein [Mariniradius sediminis]